MSRALPAALVVIACIFFVSLTPPSAHAQLAPQQGLVNGYGYGLGYLYAGREFRNVFPHGNPATNSFALGAFPNLVMRDGQVHPGLGNHGYYGGGYNNGYRYHVPFQMRVEEPPYFAKFPPVYYDTQIVRRPYGISPFAAPPGIIPTEMYYAPPGQPVKIVNPYADPAEELPPSPSDDGNDT